MTIKGVASGGGGGVGGGGGGGGFGLRVGSLGQFGVPEVPVNVEDVAPSVQVS